MFLLLVRSCSVAAFPVTAPAKHLMEPCLQRYARNVAENFSRDQYRVPQYQHVALSRVSLELEEPAVATRHTATMDNGTAPETDQRRRAGRALATTSESS